MAIKTVLVIASQTENEGVYSYWATVWAVVDGRGTFPGGEGRHCEAGQVQRSMHVEVNDDLRYRVSSDTVYDYRFGEYFSGPYTSHEITCDDVAADMIEVALAEAYPEAYSKRNRKIEEAGQDGQSVQLTSTEYPGDPL